MKYYSTRSKTAGGFKDGVSFATAALTGLAPDGGLFIPVEMPRYAEAVITSFPQMTFHDIAIETIKPFVKEEIPISTLEDMVQSAFTFPAPLVAVGDRLVLELFHGPTAAFKDFGARFMARAFSFLRRGEDKPLHILVATSGDTGGAVAEGFFGVEGVFVTVLYPKGRVSSLQERQIAGLGGNIKALAVEGSFDDCQRLVKAAFADEGLKERMALSSANSINVARLIPQAVYYAVASAEALRRSREVDWNWPRNALVSFCVPSGNFGNLTAGLYAHAMGAPIKRFIAATNINKTVPEYLETSVYSPRESRKTLSTAMDVGAPSNFDRMTAHWSFEVLRKLIIGAWASDDDTRKTITDVHKKYGYFLDPHTAAGWAGFDRLDVQDVMTLYPCAILATAHPAKFAEIVEPLTCPIPVPPAIQNAVRREPHAITIPVSLAALLEAI
ncbi:MAG: threonine synthase [Treponema sp.]|jgi:threonine synthase|nr:threonine synthase [Treponema sp.]